MDVVCFGQQNWDYCWTGKQQLLSRLARRGHRVLYVDPEPDNRPAGARESLRLLAGRGARREVHGELWTYTPPTLRCGWRASRRLDGAMLNAVLRRLGFAAPAALAMLPLPLDRIERIDPLGIVYYAVDEHAAFGGMTEEGRRQVRMLEESLLARADRALAVSPRLLGRFRRINPRSFLLENGADVEHWAPERLDRHAPHPALAGIRGPVLGFIGQVDERLDQPLLAAVADARPDWTIVLAGRAKAGVDLSALAARPNIRLLGYQPYGELPRLARRADVWLVPYVASPLTHSCNPLKVFEYLATGRPVVSVPLDGLVACRSAVALADGAEAFIAAVERALADPQDGRERRLALARANDWDGRVDALEAHLREAAGRAAAARGLPVPAVRLMTPAQARRRLAAGLPVNEYGGIPQPSGFGAAAHLLRRATRAAGLLMRLGRRRGAPKRILVVRQSRLGDLAALLPALAALHDTYPAAEITLALQPGSGLEELAAACPFVDKVAVLDFAWSKQPMRRLAGAWRLAAAGYDLVITGSRWFFLAEALFTGTGRRIGVFDGDPLQAVDGRSLPRDVGRHEADNNLDLFEALTGRRLDAFRRPLLPVDAARVAARRTEMAALLGLPDEAPVLLVHPGANRPSRRWPPDLLAAALTSLLADRPELHLVFTGVAAERALVEEVSRRLPPSAAGRLRDMTGRTDLHGLVALLDRAAALLCNDTGVLHLARARGTPLVATLGPENHRLWGPYPVGPAPAVALRVEVPCAPCAVKTCDHLFCLRSLDPRRVAAETGALLAAGRPPAGGEVAASVHLERADWGALARAGHALPLVSVVRLQEAGESPEAAVGAALAAAERQLYPALEVVVALRPGAGWDDPRDDRARAMLPVRILQAEGDGWPRALRLCRGELIALNHPGDDWWWGRIGADVAAALRAPEASAFRDGLPITAPGREELGRTTMRRPAARTWAAAMTAQGSPAMTAPRPRGGLGLGAARR